MSFEDAINLIRKQPNVSVIWYGIDTKTDYIFAVSPHDKVLSVDSEAYLCVLNKETNKISITRNIQISQDDLDNKVYIDMKPEEFGSVVY